MTFCPRLVSEILKRCRREYRDQTTVKLPGSQMSIPRGRLGHISEHPPLGICLMRQLSVVFPAWGLSRTRRMEESFGPHPPGGPFCQPREP